MPQRKDLSGKAWSDACDFRVKVWLKFMLSALSDVKNVTTRLEWGQLKHHKEVKYGRFLIIQIKN